MQTINPLQISESHRRQYHDEGYFILERAIPDHHLALLRDEAERAMADVHRQMDEKHTDILGANHRNKRYFILWHKETGRLADFLFSDYMAEVCRATLGENAYLFYDQYVIKTEKTGVQFSWHQDSGYVRAPHKPYVSCWCALDDVSESNGTVYILPYSRAGVRDRIEHKQVGTDMVGYFGDDPGIPLDTVDKMKAALATGTPAAKASSFVVYPEAGHAFHADYRPSYVKSAAEDGWQRATAWFKANGVA